MTAIPPTEGDVIGLQSRPQEELRLPVASAVPLLVARVGLAVGILVVWEMSSGAIVSTLWVSKPSAIAAVWVDWVASGYLFLHIGVTLQEMLLGFIAGSTSAIAVGVLLGRSRFLAALLDPFITALYSLPKIALAPLFVIWFGIGISMKVMMAAVIVFFLVFWNTYGGVRSVDRDLVDVVRVLGASRRQILLKVVIPSALPWIFTGLKLAVPYSLIGAIVGEIIASNRGLGHVLAAASGRFDTAALFAGLFTLTIISGTMNALLNRSEKRFLRWKQPVS